MVFICYNIRVFLVYIFCTPLIIYQLACSSIWVKVSTRNQNGKRSSSSRRDWGRSSGQNASASAVRWTGKLCAGHQVCPGVCPAAGWDGGIGMAHGGGAGSHGVGLAARWLIALCWVECVLCANSNVPQNVQGESRIRATWVVVVVAGWEALSPCLAWFPL